MKREDARWHGHVGLEVKDLRWDGSWGSKVVELDHRTCNHSSRWRRMRGSDCVYSKEKKMKLQIRFFVYVSDYLMGMVSMAWAGYCLLAKQNVRLHLPHL